MAHLKGSQHPRAKLTEEKVRELFRLYFQEDWSSNRLARYFQMDKSTLTRILRGEGWTHLDHQSLILKALTERGSR